MENLTRAQLSAKTRAEKRQMRQERSAKAAQAAGKVHSAKKCATAASASAVSTPGNNASWSHEEKIDNSTAAFSVRGEHQCHESGLGARAQTGNVGHGHDGIHGSSMTVESGVNVKNEKSFEEERTQKRDAPCCSQQQPVFFDNNEEEEAFVENRPCSSLALPGTPHQFDSPSPSPSINVLTDQSAGHQMDQNLDQIDENVSNDGIMEVSQENVQTTTARKGSQQPKCREKTPPRAQSETPAGHSISGIEQPANNSRSSAPPIFVEPTEAEGVMDENIGQSDDQQNDLQEQEEVEEHQQQNGEHSICAFDPVTKKLFYEPHKRPGCADIYCLSHVTQIGERVCNIENKLNQLEELFGKLIGQKSGPSTATNDNALTSIQQQPRVVVPQNNFPNFIPTTVVQPRGCQPMLGNHQLQPVLIPPFPTGPRYVSRILASNLSNQLPAPRMPSLIYNPVPLPAPPKPPYQYRPRAGWPIWLSAAGEQTLSKKEPILHPIAVPFIPLKPMKYNVRIYFIKDKDRASNMCPICFAIFTEGPTGSHPHCRVYLKDGTGSIPSDHYNLHNSQIIDRRTVESYLCSFCSHGGDTYRIQFLSVAAVLQHLLNTHGMKTKDLASNTVRTLYIRARNPRAAKALLHKFVQNGLGKLVREKPDNVVEADHLQPQKKKHPRRRADSPDFLEKGDLLDKLLDCPAPCTLLERNRRLKKLERLPANNLIVNINESMIGENDFVLTGKDLDALMADKQSHRTSGKKAGSRTISRSPSRSTAVSSNECSSRKRGRGQRDRTKSCSSTASGVTIDSGQLEEDQEQEEEEEEMASTDENNGSRESSEEDEGRKGALKRKWTKGLKDPDYRSAGAESAKKAMKPSSSSAPAPSPPPTMASFQSFHNPAVPSSQDPFDMTGSIPNALPNLRPSFALIRQFGYVASKGIYGSPSKTTEETQKQSSNGAANCQR